MPKSITTMQNVSIIEVGIRAPEQLAKALRRIRRQRGLTQKDVALRAGIVPRTLSNLERGHKGTELGTLFAVCAVLDLDLALMPRKKAEEVDFLKIFERQK